MSMDMVEAHPVYPPTGQALLHLLNIPVSRNSTPRAPQLPPYDGSGEEEASLDSCLSTDQHALPRPQRPHQCRAPTA